MIPMAFPDVEITKLDHLGKPVLSYPGEIVYRDGQVIVVRCVWSHERYDFGPFDLEPGDIFIEYYYPNRWFNIFEIYDLSGTLKGWYCNLTAPVALSNGKIRWRDLALDLLVLPNGEDFLLDEDEFEALSPSTHIRRHAQSVLNTLRRWRRENHPPF